MHWRYSGPMGIIGLASVAHAIAFWPTQAVGALFVGGAVIAVSAELIGVWAGVLEHRLEPQVWGVPVPIVVAWPGTIYLALRLAQLVVATGPQAAVLAALFATAIDLVLDPIGVRDGAWQYPEAAVSRHRYLSVPYWNVLAWLLISVLTALLPTVIV
ncbi:MAG: carotenoid biosynthesis protein [Halobacteriales archaeon]